MKIISNMAHVVYDDMNKFYVEVGNAISQMQGNGAEVDVQYQVSQNNIFSALIIGRVDNVNSAEVDMYEQVSNSLKGS